MIDLFPSIMIILMFTVLIAEGRLKRMKLKFKKLHESAVLPSYAKAGDAGLDLTAISCEYNPDLDSYIYDTGLAVEIPEGYYGMIVPRSSVYKTPHILSNSCGVVDSGYRGSIKVIFKNHHIKQKTYNVGDRIAQMIITPYPSIEPEFVDELSETERGESGHGSSGN